jgi:hypothetical protein
MGILIMQDIFAVVFLALSTGKVPSLWALGLFAFFPLRRVLMRFMTQAGHGELLILYGFGMAFGTWTLFDLVGLKGDLGALFVGALLAAHPSAGEMSKKLTGFKDVLLVGFFLSIGTTGRITADTLLIALLLAVAVIVKVALYFLILGRFRLRAHTSVLTSLSLANYSEFGLIVGAVALSNGWLSGDWLVIIALALTITFITAAPLNAIARNIAAAIQKHISRFESPRPLPEDVPIGLGDARFAIIGMARLGAGAYDMLKAKYGDVLIGTDPDPSVVARHQAAGRNVILADVTDDNFCFRVGGGQVDAVLLAMNEYEENLGTARRIQRLKGGRVLIFAVAGYPEQSDALRAAGVTAVWDLDTEAGTGFAEEVISRLGGPLDKEG